MDVVDRLITLHAIDPGMDVYQNIRACHEEKRNERARLLLDYISSEAQTVFWKFQDALVCEACGDLATRRDDHDVGSVAESFSVLELPRSTTSVECSNSRAMRKKSRPASVELVIEKLKKRYRKRKMASLDGQASRKSLDDLQVNICLLSAERLAALCGCGPQRQPFGIGSLRATECSVVNLEDVFKEDENGEVPDMQVASGIAGSGKTLAFTKKAPFEWSKEDHERAFWDNISLFFEGTLTDEDWWNAESLAEVFGLVSFGLTKEEEDEVVRYIRSHAEEVLLVADSLDEANVKTNSLLWRVLKGDCKAVEGLKVIICSRPCEKTAWLAKNCPFDRHLEVVGFTEEKIEQFVRAYFRADTQTACELQAQLAIDSNVRSLMHTPLLAMMICRQFELNQALPDTQTNVYQSAVIAMLQQSAARDGGTVPSNILGTLSPPRDHLHQAVASLCQLAYNAMSKKRVVFTQSELETAGCLDYAVRLGFLSASPGDSIAGRADVFSFFHHTMLEFFSAVHAVQALVAIGKKTIKTLVDELGVDGDLARFWVFVSGLLGGAQCEALLSSLLRRANEADNGAEESRRILLLFDCYTECASKLRGRSYAVGKHLETRGLLIPFTHLSADRVRSVCHVIHHYHSVIAKVNLNSTTFDPRCLAQVIATLRACSNLVHLELADEALGSHAVGAVVEIIEKNATTLQGLLIPAGDEDCEAVAQAVQTCNSLHELRIGSQALTDASALLVANLLRHQPALRVLGLSGRFTDSGFSAVITSMTIEQSMQLLELQCYWPEISTGTLCSVLQSQSLTRLNALSLYGVSIGDEGLRQLSACHSLPRRVSLCNVGITAESIPSLKMLLQEIPAKGECTVVVGRGVLSEKAGLASFVEAVSLKLVEKKRLSSPAGFYGLDVSDVLAFRDEQMRTLFILF